MGDVASGEDLVEVLPDADYYAITTVSVEECGGRNHGSLEDFTLARFHHYHIRYCGFPEQSSNADAATTKQEKECYVNDLVEILKNYDVYHPPNIPILTTSVDGNTGRTLIRERRLSEVMAEATCLLFVSKAFYELRPMMPSDSFITILCGCGFKRDRILEATLDTDKGAVILKGDRSQADHSQDSLQLTTRIVISIDLPDMYKPLVEEAVKRCFRHCLQQHEKIDIIVKMCGSKELLFANMPEDVLGHHDIASNVGSRRECIIHGRAFILGPGEGGKSAFVDSLQGNEFKKGNSTIGMDINHSKCFASSDSDVISLASVTHMEQQLHHLLSKPPKDEQPTRGGTSGSSGPPSTSSSSSEPPVPPSFPSNDEQHTRDAASRNSEQAVPPSLPADGDRDRSLTEKILRDYIDHMMVDIRAGKMTSEEIDRFIKLVVCFIDFWDFGGQRPFQAIHSMLLSCLRCVYFVVFDISKELHEEYVEVFTYEEDGVQKKCVAERSMGSDSSYFGVIESWIQTVHQVSDSVRITLVGTHTDVIRDEYKEKADAELKRRMKALIEGFRGKEYERSIRLVCVDNTLSGKAEEEQDPVVKDLRKELVDSVKRQTAEERVPLKWLPFGVYLDDMAKDSASKILPKREVMEQARRYCGGDEDSAEQMVQFYHNLGRIVVTSNEGQSVVPGAAAAIAPGNCDDNVVIDVAWTMKATGLLLAPMETPTDGDVAVCQRYFDAGVLHEALALHRWSLDDATENLAKEAGSAVRHCLMSILNRFGVLYGPVEVVQPDGNAERRDQHRDRIYYVPAIATQSVEVEHGIQSPPLYIYYGDGTMLPQDRFMNVAVRFLQSCQPLDENIELGDVTHRLGYDGFFIDLTYRSNAMKICIERDGQSGAEHAHKCSSVIEFLLRTLPELDRTYHRKKSLQLAVACECHRQKKACLPHGKLRCAEIECLHLAPVSPTVEPHCKLGKGLRADISRSVWDYWLQWLYKDKTADTVFRPVATDAYMADAESAGDQKRAAELKTPHPPPYPPSENPWRSSCFRKHWPTLVEQLSCGTMRRHCYANELITDDHHSMLKAISDKATHNEELLVIVRHGTPASFRLFCRFIRETESVFNFCDVLKDFDAMCPPDQ